ncbi:MAG: tRNA threonylcarbamoyladenosine dehydratase [Clostridia bacterium]|nr:tRNA threonylcarbamoyladenosine dehydratase [Clostridia bacterium]
MSDLKYNRLQRTEKLIGAANLSKLVNSSVLVVGLGGVGGCAFEMLVRAGVGKLTVVDCDTFDETNLNRQILCTVLNIGRAKTEAAVLRAAEIAPDCRVEQKFMRYSNETAEQVFCERYDYVADCIDSVADKTDLIVRAVQSGIPVISAMGSGNRLAPRFEVKDVFKTSGDGLARVMRKKLREAGIKSLKTVCDAGLPIVADGVPGTVSYAPNAAGCLMAQQIVTDIIWKE